MEAPTPPSTEDIPLSRSAHRAIDQIADTACQAATHLARQSERLRQASREVRGCCRSYIQAHPVSAVAAAAAAGFLLRHLLNQRDGTP